MVVGFSVEIEEKQNIPIIHVNGEIDIYTCPELRNTLTELIENGSRNLILDLENIKYIDSTGLGTIAHMARSIESDNGQVIVISTNNQIKKIFQVSGLEKKNIRLCESETIALKELS
jgi:anti-sigma B factor antagonist